MSHVDYEKIKLFGDSFCWGVEQVVEHLDDFDDEAKWQYDFYFEIMDSNHQQIGQEDGEILGISTGKTFNIYTDIEADPDNIHVYDRDGLEHGITGAIEGFLGELKILYDAAYCIQDRANEIEYNRNAIIDVLEDGVSPYLYGIPPEDYPFDWEPDPNHHYYERQKEEYERRNNN